MEITFDPNAKAVYMRIAKSNAKFFNTEELQTGRIFVDKDRKGNILGIEILWVERFNVKVYPQLKEK